MVERKECLDKPKTEINIHIESNENIDRMDSNEVHFYMQRKFTDIYGFLNQFTGRRIPNADEEKKIKKCKLIANKLSKKVFSYREDLSKYKALVKIL